MMKRLPYLLLLLICIGWAYAQSTETILVEEDFSDAELSPNIAITGSDYEVADGQLNMTAETPQFMIAVQGRNWQDYRLSTRLKLTAGSVWLQIYGGAELCTGYYLIINSAENSIDLAQADDSCQFTILENTSWEISPDRWYDAWLEIEEGSLRAAWDGEILFERRSETDAQGYPILSFVPADEAAQVNVDYFRVAASGIDSAVTTPSPIPPTMTATAILPSPGPTQTQNPSQTPTALSTVLPTVSPQPTFSPTAPPTITPTLVESTPMPPVDVPRLNDYAAAPESAAAELQRVGLIPAGGQVVFTDQFEGFSRAGEWFSAFVGDRAANNVVMAGELTFYAESENQTEICALSLRIQRTTEGAAVSYIDVGLNNRGDLFLSDTSTLGAAPTSTDFASLNLEPGRPHHLLLIAMGGELTVYVDGARIFNRVPIVQREGVFGLSMQSQSRDSRCEARNLWGYVAAQ